MPEWKDIPEYTDLYEASTDGKIRSKEGKVTYSERHGRRVWKSRELKQKVSKDNCHRVSLYKDKKIKTWLVHRLVAFTFLEEIKGKNYVKHKDGDRCNNKVSNLEWCNHKENNNHAFDNDLIRTGTKCDLVNIETKKCLYFRSLSKASDFLGKNNKYLWKLIKEGKTEALGYEIFISARANSDNK